MDIKETIQTLKTHFKEHYRLAQENKKAFAHNNKFYVQAEKEAIEELKIKYAEKFDASYYCFEVYNLKFKKINLLANQLIQYHPIDDKINLTLKHIIYNILRNKKRGHTHDDQKFINTHKATAKLICERMGLQQEILEMHHG